jgi:hypothetical protein
MCKVRLKYIKATQTGQPDHKEVVLMFAKEPANTIKR